MTRKRFTFVLRVALAIGFAIDAYVAALSLFAPALMTPLLDIPMHDPLLAQFGGAEFVVVALVYALAFRDPGRLRPLLWVCALDQLFGVVMPALAVAHGAVPPTWKVIAPIPLQAVLVLLFAIAAARPDGDRTLTHDA